MLAGGSILLGSFISSGLPLPPSSATTRLLQSDCFGIAARFHLSQVSDGRVRAKTDRAHYVLVDKFRRDALNANGGAGSVIKLGEPTGHRILEYESPRVV